MDEALSSDRLPTDERRNARPRGFVSRVLGSLLVALLTFSVTVYFLARAEREDPRAVVTAQLEALSSGDLARAYLYFSVSYRAGISFEVFRHIVAMHRPLFRTRQVRFAHHAISGDRADLEVHITTATGADYPVEYHLVREQGAWRVRDFRYHLLSGAADSSNARI